MPRFYFDIDDGDRTTHDDDGSDLHDREEARRQAIAVLPDIARDVLPDGNHRVFQSLVRDEEGHIIFKAMLTLAAEWVI